MPRAHTDERAQLLNDSAGLRRHEDSLYLTAPEPRLQASYVLAVPGVLELPHGRLVAHAQLDESGPGCAPEMAELRVLFASHPAAPALLQTRGRSRPVRELFREAGVLPWARAVHPLVFDSAGLLAIPGVAIRDATDGSDAPRGGYHLRWEPRIAISD